MAEANDIDLITLAQVKSWLNIPATNTDDDNTIQFLITGFSKYVLDYTGIDCFNDIKSYSEIHDGNGSGRIFVRNTPIVSVSAVKIGSYTLPQSTTLTGFGWFIDSSKKSIAIRTGSQATGSFPARFTAGLGNVQIDYKAGYSEVPFALGEAAMKAVAINYKRKDWIDLASKSISAGSGTTGTTRYRDWSLPPEISQVLDTYSRYARP